MTFKLIFIPALVIGGTQIVTSGAETIILAATTLAAMGYLWARVVIPTRRFTQRIGVGIDHLETLPQFRIEVTERLDLLDTRVDMLAETDRLRIKDAISGDQRSPVGRRSGDDG